MTREEATRRHHTLWITKENGSYYVIAILSNGRKAQKSFHVNNYGEFVISLHRCFQGDKTIVGTSEKQILSWLGQFKGDRDRVCKERIEKSLMSMTFRKEEVLCWNLSRQG